MTAPNGNITLTLTAREAALLRVALDVYCGNLERVPAAQATYDAELPGLLQEAALLELSMAREVQKRLAAAPK